MLLRRNTLWFRESMFLLSFQYVYVSQASFFRYPKIFLTISFCDWNFPYMKGGVLTVSIKNAFFLMNSSFFWEKRWFWPFAGFEDFDEPQGASKQKAVQNDRRHGKSSWGWPVSYIKKFLESKYMYIRGVSRILDEMFSSQSANKNLRKAPCDSCEYLHVLVLKFSSMLWNVGKRTLGLAEILIQ